MDGWGKEMKMEKRAVVMVFKGGRLSLGLYRERALIILFTSACKELSPVS